MISAVGDDLDKAIARVVDLAGWDVFKINDRFLVFAFTAFELCLAKPQRNNSGRGIGNASKTDVVWRIFGFVDNVGSEKFAFVVGKFSGR